MLGLEQLAPEDRKVVARGRRRARFLTQPFFATEHFSGTNGNMLSTRDSPAGCERTHPAEFTHHHERVL